MKKLIYLNLHLYEKQIIELCTPARKSIYEEMPTPAGDGNKRMVFTSTDEILASKTSIRIDKINNILTLEQKGRWIDKSTYDYYESFKGGQEVNSLVRSMMPLSESEKDFVESIKRETLERQLLDSKTK